jgi:carbamoyltransferase
VRILGLNGWPGRGHDPAACLLVDGRLVACAEEERFVRRKHAYGAQPLHAAAFCLDRAGLTLDEVDVVAFGWDIPLLHRDRDVPWRHTPGTALEALLPAEALPRSRDPELVFVSHHLAHAASAYHLAGDARAAVLVLDGQGERESTSLGVGVDGRLRMLETWPPGWSLGYFYDAVGRYIGLGADQAGKTMGLAAYGSPGDISFGTFDFDDPYTVRHVPADLRSGRHIDDSEEATDAWLRQLAAVLPLPPNPVRRRYDPATGRMRRVPDRDPFEYADVAATAQAALEHVVTAMVGRLMRTTGERILHVAGGVGFNASLNGVLLRHPAVDRLFVQPLAGDAGVALGAAVHVATEAGDRVEPMTTSISWGPEFGPDTVRAALEDANLPHREPADLTEAVADRIAAGQVVGWCQGPAEVGPRALGHRSILADPATRAQRDRVNLRIKRREWWRPLAPSMTIEDHKSYVDTPAPLPYMITTTPLQDGMRQRLAAVDHVDGTTRSQTVDPEDEPLYHRLLVAIGERTGAPVLLNTSFNGTEEPVVCTPQDAVRTWAELGLDALAIGPFLVSKR